MEQHDKQLENYLREFQPRRPRALPMSEKDPILMWRRLAAAVRFSRLSMTQLAVNDPQQLDAVLASASRSELPDFRAEDSTLRVLAKEYEGVCHAEGKEINCR